MRVPVLLMALAMLCLSCNKVSDVLTTSTLHQRTEYIIEQGQQFSNLNKVRPVEITEQKFLVQFDSTAIYQTTTPENQFDINKLYGFSDNNGAHHQYSARIGWRWSDNALRLFAYVYNAGVVSSKELTEVPLGKDIHCSITIAGNSYVFKVGDGTWTLPRLSLTEKGKGYQLYPYFGGNETAPHQVRIWIEEE